MKTEQAYGVIPCQKRGDAWHFFLVHHQAGHWAFPKGRPEVGESHKETAERELFEECGLKVVRYLHKEPLQEHYTLQRDGVERAKTVTYFLAEVDGEVALQAEEIAAGEWLSPEEALKRLTFPEARSLCQRAHALLP